jgi:hypothetical protein
MPTPANSLLAIIGSLGKDEVKETASAAWLHRELYGTPAATRL